MTIFYGQMFYESYFEKINNNKKKDKYIAVNGVTARKYTYRTIKRAWKNTPWKNICRRFLSRFFLQYHSSLYPFTTSIGDIITSLESYLSHIQPVHAPAFKTSRELSP